MMEHPIPEATVTRPLVIVNLPCDLTTMAAIMQAVTDGYPEATVTGDGDRAVLSITEPYDGRLPQRAPGTCPTCGWEINHHPACALVQEKCTCGTGVTTCPLHGNSAAGTPGPR